MMRLNLALLMLAAVPAVAPMCDGCNSGSNGTTQDCGNGVVEGSEACDDGADNGTAASTCDATCALCDGDGDGECAPFDACPNDPNKLDEGTCGCGVTEDLADDDGDSVVNCLDLCHGNDAFGDTDGDGTCDTPPSVFLTFGYYYASFGLTVFDEACAHEYGDGAVALVGVASVRDPADLGTWPLIPGVTYYNEYEEPIGTVASNGMFTFPLEHSIAEENVFPWVGYHLNDDASEFYVRDNCNDWSSHEASDPADVAFSTSQWDYKLSHHELGGGLGQCDSARQLYCVLN